MIDWSAERWAETRLNWRHWTVDGEKIANAIQAGYIGYAKTDQGQRDPQLAAQREEDAARYQPAVVTRSAESGALQRKIDAIKDGLPINAIPESDLQMAARTIEQTPDGRPTGYRAVTVAADSDVDVSRFEPVTDEKGQHVKLRGTLFYRIPVEVAERADRRRQEMNYRRFGTDRETTLESDAARKSTGTAGSQSAPLSSSLKSAEYAERGEQGPGADAMPVDVDSMYADE
jgi:hypothetical protein